MFSSKTVDRLLGLVSANSTRPYTFHLWESILCNQSCPNLHDFNKLHCQSRTPCSSSASFKSWRDHFQTASKTPSAYSTTTRKSSITKVKCYNEWKQQSSVNVRQFVGHGFNVRRHSFRKWSPIRRSTSSETQSSHVDHCVGCVWSRVLKWPQWLLRLDKSHQSRIGRIVGFGRDASSTFVFTTETSCRWLDWTWIYSLATTRWPAESVTRSIGADKLRGEDGRSLSIGSSHSTASSHVRNGCLSNSKACSISNSFIESPSINIGTEHGSGQVQFSNTTSNYSTHCDKPTVESKNRSIEFDRATVGEAVQRCGWHDHSGIFVWMFI